MGNGSNGAALAKAQPTAMASLHDKRALDTLRQTIARDANDQEFALFLQVCRHKGLDPFSRQIHCVTRFSRGQRHTTYQVGIDGFRVIAERTGDYDGQDPPEWCGKDGQWRDIWTEDEPPFAARVKVYRKGISRPFVATAEWRSYVQTKKDGNPNSMWLKMGPHMLAKCAESLALRKAFPDDLAGLYSTEEMHQAGGSSAGSVEAIVTENDPEMAARIEEAKAAQQKRIEEWKPAVEQWRQDVADLVERVKAEDLDAGDEIAGWIYHHGGMLRQLPEPLKAPVWRWLVTNKSSVVNELGLSTADVRQWLADAPDEPEREDDFAERMAEHAGGPDYPDTDDAGPGLFGGEG